MADTSEIHAGPTLPSLRLIGQRLGWALAAAACAACQSTAWSPLLPDATLMPAAMPVTGAVDERYLSYNIEMLEVTGSKIRNRPPLDLAHPRLRRLAAALGPSYVRISGTGANTTYFADTEPSPATAPAGFTDVLTRRQWQGVIEFANAVDAEIVTSFATSAGTRDAQGVWTPEQARRLAAFTRSAGGHIAAASLMHEPNLAATGGAPAGYDAAAYGRDFQRFHSFARQEFPGMLILGPGSVGGSTGGTIMYGNTATLGTRDLLAATGPGLDAFSYHHYGAASIRCQGIGPATSAADGLSEAWLARTDETLAFYRNLRDVFEPGKPMWNTETADATCGGNPWAGTFLDSFRFLDQLGRLARQDVEVVAHNTLVGGHSGLLDETTLLPKPNYWAALLWRQLMGSTVLDPGVPIQPGLHVYAHCLRGVAGGVALLAINNDPLASRVLRLPDETHRFTLSAMGPLQTRRVALNGAELQLREGDLLPLVPGMLLQELVTLQPATITFLTVPRAGHPACR